MSKCEYSCPRCKRVFEKKTKFCPQCGCNVEEKLIKEPLCPSCKKGYPLGTIYCPVDGARLFTSEPLIPKCVICGRTYSEKIKFCPNDGGKVSTEEQQIDLEMSTERAGFVKADIFSRFIASFLDGLVSGVLSIPGIILYRMGIIETESYKLEDYSLVLFILSFILFLIPLIYSLIKNGLGQGQSLGKKAMGLRVISIADGSNCTMGRSVARELVATLLGMIPFGLFVELIAVLLSTDGRRLADHIVGTMVVNA